nr:hypothetical protein [uncultured Flavobacterium sp.]
MKKSIITLGLGFILFACADKDDKISAEDKPTSAEFHNLIDNAMQQQTQTFQMDAEDGYVTFTSTKGVQFSIDGTCLTLNGNPVSGSVDVRYVEIFDAGTMAATKKSTMGTLPDGNKAMLMSGGTFYINAFQDGNSLQLTCPITLSVPTVHTNPGGNPLMALWNGTEDEEGNVTWAAHPVTGDHGVAIGGQGSSAIYTALVSNFGWTNVDCFYSSPEPKTTILASVPEGYNSGNCAIYLHYDGVGNGLANLDTYDAGTGLFSEHYGQIPINLDCHIIFVTEKDGQWRYAIKDVTIAANETYDFSLNETTVGSKSQLIAAINALP